jgi:hypothetical protein
MFLKDTWIEMKKNVFMFVLKPIETDHQLFDGFYKMILIRFYLS